MIIPAVSSGSMSLSRFSLWFFLLTVLAPSPLSAGLTDPSLKWRTLFTEHFAIHFHEGEEGVAKKMETISEEVYQKLSKSFDARPWGRTEVVLIDNDDQANGFTLVIPYNLVILRVVQATSGSMLADYDDWLRELFMHEYTHVIHITDTGYPAKLLKFGFGTLIAPNGLTPGWVTEGIATYFETTGTTRGRGRSSYTDMLLRTDILQDRFLHLDQMAGTMYDWPNWQSQYLYGVGFWKFLSEKYGEKSLLDFSRKYGSSLRFFMLNSQAKRVWKKERTEEEEKLCAEDQWSEHKTWKARKTYPETCGDRGLSFYKLWDEWKAELTQRYAVEKEKLTGAGLREGETLLVPQDGESLAVPTLSPDGKSIAYLATSVHHRQEFRLRDIETEKERVLLKKRDVQQAGFSPDGTKIIISNIGTHKRYNQYSDLHEITIETGKVKQLTKGKRARDPDYSPDGKKIVAVIQKTGTAQLGVYDPESETWKEFFEGNQLDHPRWMADGRHVVVSAHKDARRDLWMVDAETGEGRRVTDDVSIDDRPTVDREGREVYFSSDVSGIPNIYRLDLSTKKTTPVTNVLTGAFAPSVGPDGELVYQYYTGKGFEIRKLNAVGAGYSRPSIEPDRGARTAPLRNDEIAPVLESKKYNPFRKLLVPRYILPNVALIDSAVFASATVSNFDPLSRHYWFGDVTYRSDNNFVGFDVGYTYSRYRPSFFAGFSDNSVSYGDFLVDVASTPEDTTDDLLISNFFEERRRGYAGFSLPIGGGHKASLQYFFEDRSEQSATGAGAFLGTLGRYAGLNASYSYTRLEGTAARISPESGERASVNFEMTDHWLGSSNNLEQQVVWGDFRKYIKMPYADHHVLALRAAGGVAFGDQLLQNFGIGGAIGESPFSGTSNRVFTLRGLPLVTFAGDRAWVASAEYRMPIFRLQRGIGTLPFALNSAHLSLFADVGDAFYRGNLSFRPMLGVGAELRGDFILAWHIPVMGRLGYGIILTNRDRITGVQDSLTGADARNGVVIFELGTSF